MSGYKLPFPNGTEVVCTQGNNDSFSHYGRGQYAWDLVPLPERMGAPIAAAATGVVYLKEDSQPDDSDRPNYLVIRHPEDGYCDLYTHLKHTSVSEFGLSVGSQVMQGQLVARVGHTGRATGPHLHFQRQHCGTSYWQQSVPITFDDVQVDGGVPQKNQHYISGNTELQPTSLKDALVQITAQRATIKFKAASAFAAFARQNNLGAPLSDVSQLSSPDAAAHFVQVFDTDTLYLPMAASGDETEWDNVHRMSSLLLQNLNDPWGLALWGHTYANAGVEFNPRWASHQFALNQLATRPLGAPLGGGSVNGVHVIYVAGQRYEAEVYARDTIYWAPPAWSTIRRMSDLQDD